MFGVEENRVVSASKIEKISREFEEVYAKEYRKAMEKLENSVSDPKKRLKIVRKIALRKANNWLKEKHGLNLKLLDAKKTASNMDVSLEMLAVG